MADTQHSTVVSEDPVDLTPHVLDGVVNAITIAGEKVIVGGEFTQVQNSAAGSPAIERVNIFAYDRATGLIEEGFAPQIDGAVASLETGEDGTVYVGGLFNTVSGQVAKRLARVNVADGSLHPDFTRAQVNWGTINAIVRRGQHLYIGGRFDTVSDPVTGVERHVLARLDSATGAVDPAFDITLSEARRGELLVKGMAVNPAGTKLVINGTFTKVNCENRYQIAMIDLGQTVTLSTWETHKYGNSCLEEYDTYMRGMDFSPDGSYFVVVTAGGAGFATVAMCDSAARWETDRTGRHQEPTWINYTGGDTLLSVSVTGAAIYVGGHQRWMDNPYGYNSAGPGAVERQGIAAIDPTTGKSADIPWNPTRTLGQGAGALVATPDGLLVGSDTDQLGGEFHGRIGEFPLP
ncbi:delta-60 repeat domain-containing protein [Spirillospora sp. NPDC048819]|uniref:delta-60 repeat domain-containing protein n=1 Tax=Spirillospora sp. NPDC048819 TaxID=3155268 RepID=UPI0034113898